MKFNLFVLILVLTISSCYNVKFTHSNGEHFWVYSLRNDGYKANKSEVLTRINCFDIKNINSKTDTAYYRRQYEYLSAKDLIALAAKNELTAILFWLTDCPTSTYQVMKVGKVMKERGLNVFLLSTEYQLDRMDENLYRSQYLYNSYVISNNPYGNHILTKIVGFIKELDPEFYSKYKDDVFSFSCIFVDKNGKITKGYNVNEIMEIGFDGFVNNFDDLSKSKR